MRIDRAVQPTKNINQNLKKGTRKLSDLKLPPFKHTVNTIQVTCFDMVKTYKKLIKRLRKRFLKNLTQVDRTVLEETTGMICH